MLWWPSHLLAIFQLFSSLSGGLTRSDLPKPSHLNPSWQTSTTMIDREEEMACSTWTLASSPASPPGFYAVSFSAHCVVTLDHSLTCLQENRLNLTFSPDSPHGYRRHSWVENDRRGRHQFYNAQHWACWFGLWLDDNKNCRWKYFLFSSAYSFGFWEIIEARGLN